MTGGADASGVEEQAPQDKAAATSSKRARFIGILPTGEAGESTEVAIREIDEGQAAHS
jgi:hypothetical protein